MGLIIKLSSYISINVPNDLLSSFETPEFKIEINISLNFDRTQTSPSIKFSLIIHLFKFVYIIFSFFVYNLYKLNLPGLSSFPHISLKKFLIEPSA